MSESENVKNTLKIKKNLTCNFQVYLSIILIIGFLLRIYGIYMELPYLYVDDEINTVARAFFILRSGDLNPHWFGHPATTTIYIKTFIYALIFFISKIMGYCRTFDDFENIFFDDPTIFYLSARLISVFFGLATIILVYIIARKVFNKIIGLTTAFFIAINPFMIFFSKLARVDHLLVFFLLICLWYCLKILEEDNYLNHILLGCFIGLSIVTKYPAVVFITNIFYVYLINKFKRNKNNQIPRFIVSVFSCLLTTFIVSPFLYLDWKTSLKDLIYEARPEHLSANGEGLIQNIIWYLQILESKIFNVYGLFFVIIGFILTCISKDDKKQLLIVFPLTFLFFISSLTLKWERWLIPILPFLIIFLSLGIHKLSQLIEKRIKFVLSSWLALFLIITISIPMLESSLIQGRQMSLVDTRTMAADWIINNIPNGSSILIESHTPQLPVTMFKLFTVELNTGHIFPINKENVIHKRILPDSNIGYLKNLEEIKKNKIQFFIMSNVYERYATEKNKYFDRLEIYNSLINQSNLIYEIEEQYDVYSGNKIRIYQFRQE